MTPQKKTSLRDLEIYVAKLESELGSHILGQRIRRERIAQKISIRDLGSMSGVGLSSVSRLETGKTIRPITLLRICESLGLHLDRLADPDESNVVAIDRQESSNLAGS